MGGGVLADGEPALAIVEPIFQHIDFRACLGGAQPEAGKLSIPKQGAGFGGIHYALGQFGFYGVPNLVANQSVQPN
ncbi:MAG: hypothetical protein COA84_11135 [Robiginitomaculum sp.]|nr:MAG: hypothetical protein COA84_11135 [Robiginitomaculum sp.]